MVLVTGSGGGLGANVVRAAVDAGVPVRVLVRDPVRARVPPGVEVAIGDARSAADVGRAAEGTDALLHCVNVPFGPDWIPAVTAMAEVATEAARTTGARLVFPGNVWVFGRGRPGERVAEDHPLAPSSQKGAARAACEQRLRESGARVVIVRLPEFFGPFVTTLTGPPLGALAKGATATWFGPPDVEIELGFMPDAGRALVRAAIADGVDGATYHWPGHVTTPRAFLEGARARAGQGAVRFVPAWVVRAAGIFSGRAKGFADVLHLWEEPIVQDGARWRARFGADGTPLEEALDATLAWHRAHPDAWMH